MKKSLLALAVLGAFAGAATAASSVTLYGRIDMGVGKSIGSANKFISQGSGSRLGLRGAEDLGGGLAAIFNIEHRFEADTGTNGTGTGSASRTNPRFWSARSLVGLKGSFGQVTLGREYTTSFLMSQLRNDPWGYDTVATLAGITGLSLGSLRNDSAITYNGAFGPVSVGFQVAEATDTYNATAKKPMNFALGYAGGPVAVNFGYEKNGVDGHKLMTLGGSYNLGMVTLGASYSKGEASTGAASRKGYALTAVAPVGAGQLRAAIGQRKDGGTKIISALAVGYHYSLSKRTTIYADVARNGELNAEKVGYDLGIKHHF